MTQDQYWEERLSANWGLQGVGFQGLGIFYNRWLYKVREKVFKEQLKKLSLDFSAIEVLDIGSGTGFFLNLWQKFPVRKITGSDLTSASVEKLKKFFPSMEIVKFDIGAPLEASELARRQFDVVGAFDVLFHIVEDAQFARAISNLSKLLKPGGYLFYTDNFLHNKTLRVKHQVSRSLEEIVSLLTSVKFTIIRRVPVFVLMNNPIDSGSSLLTKLWRIMMWPVFLVDYLGALYGALLFPFEIILIHLLKEGPSTEFMVCMKTNKELL